MIGLFTSAQPLGGRGGDDNEDHECSGKLPNISCRLRVGRTAVPGKGAELRRGIMNATHRLHEAGQSLWLDNITPRLLTSGTLRR